MTADLTWLLSILDPQEVAPSPTLPDAAEPTEQELLALIIQGRDHEQGPPSQRPHVETPLLADVREALSQPSSGCVNRLLRAASDSSDLGQACAITLIAVVALNDIEDGNRQLEILETLLQRIAPATQPEERLLFGLVQQQLAMRMAEQGQQPLEALDTAANSLAKVALRDLSMVRTREGTPASSRRALSNVLNAAREANAAMAFSARGLTSIRAWRANVRRRSSELTSKYIRQASSGFARYSADSFEVFTNSYSNSWSSVDPVDGPVWRALLHFELIGHHSLTKVYRKHLGQLRVLRAPSLSPEIYTDALRLLRRSEDLRELNKLLTFVRTNGPLVSLRREGVAVLRDRSDALRLRDVELALLKACGQVLTAEESSNCLNLLSAALAGPQPHRLGGWQLASVHQQHILEAASEMAAISGRVDEFARVVLGLVRQASQGDDIAVRSIANALSGLEWDQVSDESKLLWVEWLAGVEGVRNDAVVSATRAGLDLEPVVAEGASGPMDVANQLNRLIASQPQHDQLEWLRSEGTETVKRFLADTRREAVGGVHSVYAIDPADLAAGLALYAGADVWGPLADFLMDPYIARRGKSAALDRLARSAENVPEAARNRFRDGVVGLLSPPQFDDPFQRGSIDPYPQALRLAAALSLVPHADLLVNVSRLVSANDTQSRLEGARVLTTLARSPSTPDWVFALAFQLSHDRAGEVRAESARTLALVARKSDYVTAIQEALTRLLDEDGLVIPLLVLHGLLESQVDLPDLVRDHIKTMAISHPAVGIRIQAAALLGEK